MIQNTRLARLQKYLFNSILFYLTGPWKRRSFSLISLLIGFYLGSNLTVYFLERTGQRPMVVLIMVLIIEALIRLRSRFKANPIPIIVLGIDNTRIGAVYAVVLEAFKLGS